MKLKIDTDNKTIQLEQSAKLVDLFSLLKKLFPNDEWKQYSIEAVAVITYWNDPIYIPYTYTAPEIKRSPSVCPPWDITCETGTFCIDTN